MGVYDELEAKCLPLIENYHTDLTKWDRQAIELHPCCPFLHWTRDTGTHIIMLTPEDSYPKRGERVRYLFGTADREHLLRQTLVVAEYCDRETHLACHYYDGVKLRSISSQDAVSIVKQYMREIERNWRWSNLLQDDPQEYRRLRDAQYA